MPRILITLGDPAGIGPEVIHAALNSPEIPEDFEFEVIGEPSEGVPGQPNERSAAESFRALRESAWKLRDDPDVAAVVTGPVSKSQLERVGFTHPGQTEFFAEQTNTQRFSMCLTGRTLTVGLATIHIPLAEVPTRLSIASIVEAGTLLAQLVTGRRGDSRGRIAVAGLNPHAGEDGRFGAEESNIISPAISLLNQTASAQFTGPHVPDAIFRAAANGEYDAVLAMYHDQGLIPLKLLDFDNAVNVTLGLPKPRTSPDHGTAFDIAGRQIARPDSMIEAIKLAATLARRS
ncbi:MAG: 4-hydroxythreonine-4-phosphate dehydrogenase PdxA [Verrucomicrobiales bacterium]